MDANLWTRLFERASKRSFFLAHSLAIYQENHQLSLEALANLLRCSPEGLLRLGLCRRPLGDTSVFRTEVEKVATYAGADPVRLAQLLREIEVITAFETADLQRGQGFLLAAREQKSKTRSSSGGGNDKEQ